MERPVLTHPENVRLVEADPSATNGYGAEVSPSNRVVALVQSKYHIVDRANAGRALDDRVEHWLHIGGRAADDAENFRGRRLVLQRLAERTVALLQLVEETN